MPKHVGEIIMTKQIFMNEFLQLVANKYSVINILYGTGTTLILICAMWRGMWQGGVMA
jgi:hypothetical protein